jgi:hypothetical protein
MTQPALLLLWDVDQSQLKIDEQLQVGESTLVSAAACWLIDSPVCSGSGTRRPRYRARLWSDMFLAGHPPKPPAGVSSGPTSGGRTGHCAICAEKLIKRDDAGRTRVFSSAIVSNTTLVDPTLLRQKLGPMQRLRCDVMGLAVCRVDPLRRPLVWHESGWC